MSVVGESSANDGEVRPANPETADRRDAVGDKPARVELRKLIAVGLPKPRVALRVDPLPVPRRADPGLVDQGRTNDPRVTNLIAGAGSRSVGRHGRQRRAGEHAVRVEQVVFVVQIPSVHALIPRRLPVDADDVLPLLEGVVELIGRVVRGRRARVLRRQVDHPGVVIGDCPSIGRDAARRNHVAGELLSGRRITQHAIVGGADDVVGAAESEGKVARELGARRQGLPRRVREAVDDAVLLTAEEEELVAENRTTERALEVLELEVGLGPVAAGVARGEVVRFVELLVAEVVPRRALEPVGSAAGHDVDGPTAVAPELGREVRRLDLDLIDEARG